MVAINTSYSPVFFQSKAYNGSAFQQHAANRTQFSGQARFQHLDNPFGRNDLRDYQASQSHQIGFKTLVEHALGPVAHNLGQNLKNQLGQGFHIASSMLNNFARYTQSGSASANTAGNTNTSANETDESRENTMANPFSNAAPGFQKQFPLPFPLTPLATASIVPDQKLQRLVSGDDNNSQALRSLVRELTRHTPQSQEALALQAQMTGLAQANPRQGAVVPRLLKEVQQAQLDNILETLQTILENIPPETSAAQNIQARIQVLQSQKANLT